MKITKIKEEWSERWKDFILKAWDEGFEVTWYSGRGMYGKECPSVTCEYGNFGFKGASTDSMGLQQVVYVR